jgi:anaerobic magnesium-protoporphyrin IX monomethyl ester cyclase
MKVLLCIPPDYEYNFPPLGTPALLGYLKAKKIDAAQVDFNMAYRDFLAAKINTDGLNKNEKRCLVNILTRMFFTQKLNGRYYSQLLPRRHGKALSDLHYNNGSNSSFYFTERLLQHKHLFRYLSDKENNTFYQFYLYEKIIERLRKDKIDLLGISVTSPSQAIPALTLGLLVKTFLPDIHVNFGGQWVTLFREELKKRDDLFQCFDSLIVFEGETPLYELCCAIADRKEPALTNVIIQKNKNPLLNTKGEDLNVLACPDFSGLPLKDYDAGYKSPVLTYEASRGCYWSKCAYCVDLPLPKPAYRAKRADIVVKEIKELIRRYGATDLMMGDPGMAPRQILEISKELIRQKIKIKWWIFARLDPGFNRKIFNIAGEAGLWQINFGFESANDKVCDFLHKGNRREISARVIADCAASGIKVNLQTIFGLPGETHNDAMDTVSFLIENKKDIAGVTFNIFYLPPHNHVYNNPERYGITYDKKGLLPFQFFIPFENKQGMTNEQAQYMMNVYYKLLAGTGQKSKNKEDHRARFGKLNFSLCGENLKLRWKRYASGSIVII